MTDDKFESLIEKQVQRENEMKEASMELTRSLLGGGSGGAGTMNAGALRKRIASLEHEKEMLLTENNIPIDYTDVRYNCRICGDTGITKEGSRCSCYEEAARMAAGSTPNA